MKKLLLATCLFVACSAAARCEVNPLAVEAEVLPDIGQAHWAYNTIIALGRAGIIHMPAHGPLMRHDCAVITARLLKTFSGKKDNLLSENLPIYQTIGKLEIRDTLAALNHEFDSQLSGFGFSAAQREYALSDDVWNAENLGATLPPILTQ
jgi:hypothetical protein